MAYILAKKEYSVANILQVLAVFHEESKKKIICIFISNRAQGGLYDLW